MTAMSKKRPTPPSEQLREIIRDCGMTRYELACRSGVQQSALSRFMAGTVGLSLESLDRLAPVLGLSIVRKRQRAKKGR
ncbi:MAG: helix-turn-helix domain-containing protein [Thermoguttaceae bacterium]|nr:helix-turn-helix domain-containing protein [Thermoguttaceae bacterium]